MSTITQLRVPPIKDENAFEDFCRDLWELVWNDPNARRNGRRGQAQCGVDVYGIPDGADRYEGVQAKAVADPLTDAEIQDEIDQAKKFDPPLRRLIIATGAPRDANGQKYVRNVNLQHRKQKLFSVELLGWEDILLLVQDHMVPQRPNLVERYLHVTTTSTAIIAAVASEVQSGTVKVTQTVEAAVLRTQDLIGSATLQGEHHAELNYARTLVDEMKPRQALEYLKDCRERFWHATNPQVRFRILHYSALAHFQLGDLATAGSMFVQALQYNDSDETAITYAAFGHLLSNNLDEARRLSEAAIAKNPGNGKALAVRIQVGLPNSTLDELVDLVPAAYRDLPEVAFALCHASRQKSDLVQAERWARTAILNAQGSVLDYHGILGEVLLARAVGGELFVPIHFQLEHATRTLLAEATDEFTAALEALAGTEVLKHRLGWLANRSLARLLLNEYSGATQDLDELLRLQPGNREWLQRRIEIALQQGDIEEAQGFARQFDPDLTDFEGSLLHAERLFRASLDDECGKLLTTLMERAETGDQSVEVRRLLLELTISKSDWEPARSQLEAIQAAKPDDIATHIMAARLARFEKNGEGALPSLQAASALVGLGTPENLVLALATELHAAGDYDGAISAYERIANKNANSSVTRRLLTCYYRAGQLANALELGQNLVRL